MDPWRSGIVRENVSLPPTVGRTARLSVASRKSMSPKKRLDIFKRDRFCCRYCGKHPPDALLHVDHIVPVVAGGTDDPTNLVTSCSECNLGKGATLLVE